MHFAWCTNATCLLETDCVFTAPLTFPLLGAMFRRTLRVSREISLTVPDDHQRVHPLSRTNYGLGLLSLSILDSAFCVMLVCCFQALFGALVPTIVSLVPTALGRERQFLHVFVDKETSTCFLRPQTCAPLSSSLPSPE